MRVRAEMTLLLLVMMIAVGAVSASAATEAAPDSMLMGYDLSEVVVTGTRTPKLLKNTPVQTRLITAAELRRADAADLSGLLAQEVPGVEFSYAMNQQTNMNLAGFSGQSVLVLVDGERLAGETMDNVDFSRLNMSGVGRIEIIRGASSALYGSNASGGVINIITREASEPWSVNLDTRVGSHGEWRAGGSVGFNVGKVSNMLNVSFNRVDSYDVCVDLADECDIRRVFGSRVWNFSDRLMYRPIPTLRLTGRAGYYFKERKYNPDIPDRYRDFSAGMRADWKVSDVDNIQLSYAFDQYDKSDFNKDWHLDIRDYSNVQHSLKALYSRGFRVADILTVGADMMRDWLSSYQLGQSEARSQYTADLFAQYDWAILEQLELVGAARWDWFSDGSLSCVTPKVSARYLLGDIALRAGYAGGFRAPTLKEKYMNFNMVDIFDIHGNPSLRPERSHNFNLSAEYTWRNYYFTAGGNCNLVDNRIATSGILYDAMHRPYIEYLNIKNMHVFGVDATVRARWACGLSASLSYNFTHERMRGAFASQYCPARPHALNARVGWTKTWREGYETDITLSGRFLSAVSYETMQIYEPFESRTIRCPAYTLWKLHLSQQLMSCLRLTLTLDNLLNYHPSVYTYNTPVTTGTSILAGLSLEL